MRVAAGDHQPGRDFHLAKQVTTGIRCILPALPFDFLGFVGHSFPTGFGQLQRVGERRQADILAGAHGDLVHRQPQRREILPQQRERPARLDDEHPWAVHRHHHQQVVDQHRRLARAGGSEDQRWAWTCGRRWGRTARVRRPG